LNRNPQALYKALRAQPYVQIAMKVTLVDLHGSLVDAACAQGWAEVELLGYIDVREVGVDSATRVTGYVSPANSLGFMDGGIDYTLSRVMFPGVERRVKAAIAALGCLTLLGRPHLPIGRAVVVPAIDPVLEDPPRLVVVAAPTMWLPQDVRGTHNAYSAMHAALTAAAAAGVDRLVVPGLCTGCGMMSASEAILQMRAAHGDFCAGRPARFDAERIVAEQPPWYENTEFKPIDPSQVKAAGTRPVENAKDSPKRGS
jgi:O-acetyl-ADP-ribose deacetylase (regulator of RNase III)